MQQAAGRCPGLCALCGRSGGGVRQGGSALQTSELPAPPCTASGCRRACGRPASRRRCATACCTVLPARRLGWPGAWTRPRFSLPPSGFCAQVPELNPQEALSIQYGKRQLGPRSSLLSRGNFDVGAAAHRGSFDVVAAARRGSFDVGAAAHRASSDGGGALHRCGSDGGSSVSGHSDRDGGGVALVVKNLQPSVAYKDVRAFFSK